MTAVQNPNDKGGGSAALYAVLAIVAFFGFAFLAASFLGGEDPVDINSDGFEAAPVTIGEGVLDQMPGSVSISTDPTVDGAIGQVAPPISGTNFSGETVEILNDGKPKAIYFVAHWCPFCQAEVPQLVEMISDGQVPEGLDIYMVSTSVDSGATNYPPSAWLDQTNWPMPIIRDDSSSTALITYGAGGFPYGVFLNSANQVVARSAGVTEKDITLQLWNAAVNAEEIAVPGEPATTDTTAIEE